MYKIKYDEVTVNFITLAEAFKKYQELRTLAWWELDIKNLKILNDDGQDITQVINDYLDGRN